MQNKLLVICGPTAVGKTGVALELAKRYDGELISADSRQIYKYMDIVTGKDIPEGFLFHETELALSGLKIGYYGNGEVRIWGYDVVRPDQEFSVKHYADLVHTILPDIYSRGKLPILVGGSGFYIDAVVNPPETINIPVNPQLRESFGNLGVQILYDMLSKADPARASAMNESDKANSRRLIRAIEIADYHQKHAKPEELIARVEFEDILWIGLNLPLDTLSRRIAERVADRASEDLVEELGYLRELGFLKYAPSRTIGYKQWINYLDGNIDRQGAIKDWINAEVDYAKRQMTWFAKRPAIKWFQADKPDITKLIAQIVETWYSSSKSNDSATAKD